MLSQAYKRWIKCLEIDYSRQFISTNGELAFGCCTAPRGGGRTLDLGAVTIHSCPDASFWSQRDQLHMILKNR